MWLLLDLVKTEDNIYCPKVFGAALAHRHVISSVVDQSDEEQGGRVNLNGLHFVRIFRGRIVAEFHPSGGVSTPFTDLN